MIYLIEVEGSHFEIWNDGRFLRSVPFYLGTTPFAKQIAERLAAELLKEDGMTRKVYIHVSFDEEVGEDFRALAKKRRITNSKLLSDSLKAYNFMRKNAKMIRKFMEAR